MFRFHLLFKTPDPFLCPTGLPLCAAGEGAVCAGIHRNTQLAHGLRGRKRAVTGRCDRRRELQSTPVLVRHEKRGLHKPKGNG